MGTAPPPPRAPAFTALADAYTPLVQRTARRAGVRGADVADVTQEVLLRLHTAIHRGLDTSRSLGGWVIRTTLRLARDLLTLNRTAREELTATGTPDLGDDGGEQRERMDDAIDLHALMETILDKMPLDERLVFVMSDLSDLTIEEIEDDLGIGRATVYKRLAGARAVFAREWSAMRASGSPAIMPFMLWEPRDLIAAEHSIPDVSSSFRREIHRRLDDALGPDLATPFAAGAGAAAGAKLAAVGATKAGAFTLSFGQLAIGAIVMAVAGAMAHDALHAPVPSTAQAAPIASTVTPAVMTTDTPTPAVVVSAVFAPLPVPTEAASAPTPPESDAILMDHARALVRARNVAKALTVLGRVKSPELAEERDDLRRRALALEDAGRP